MYKLKKELETIKDLEKLANFIYRKTNPTTLILLSGVLGVGKTAFVKLFLKNYGINENRVKSPTFSLINEYYHPDFQIVHIDLYRLNKIDINLYQEIQDYLNGKNSIVIIEWPERLINSDLTLQSKQLITLKLEFSEQEKRSYHYNISYPGA